jgi:hypothetical protein
VAVVKGKNGQLSPAPSPLVTMRSGLTLLRRASWAICCVTFHYCNYPATRDAALQSDATQHQHEPTASGQLACFYLSATPMGHIPPYVQCRHSESEKMIQYLCSQLAALPTPSMLSDVQREVSISVWCRASPNLHHCRPSRGEAND